MPLPTVPAQQLAPEINYSIKLDINTGTAELPVWSDAGTIFTNISSALNEILHQASYYADGGWGSTEVTGGQMIFTLSGSVKPGDEVSDYLTDPTRLYQFGASRHTAIRITRGTEQIMWAATLAKITPGMGDATTPNALTVEVHCNGAPSIGTVS